jgi:hypothetical protein
MKPDYAGRGMCSVRALNFLNLESSVEKACGQGPADVARLVEVLLEMGKPCSAFDATNNLILRVYLDNRLTLSCVHK